MGAMLVIDLSPFALLHTYLHILSTKIVVNSLEIVSSTYRTIVVLHQPLKNAHNVIFVYALFVANLTLLKKQTPWGLGSLGTWLLGDLVSNDIVRPPLFICVSC
jgi:hypothetical protein